MAEIEEFISETEFPEDIDEIRGWVDNLRELMRHKTYSVNTEPG